MRGDHPVVRARIGGETDRAGDHVAVRVVLGLFAGQRPESTSSCTTEWSTVTWLNSLRSKRYTRLSPMLNTAKSGSPSCSTSAAPVTVVPTP